jgi:hypothetical protein
MSTSSAINPPVFGYIGQRTGPGFIQRQLFSHDEALEQIGFHALRPEALAMGQDLVLHHRAGRAQVQQIDRAARYQHCQVEVAIGTRCARHLAAKGIDRHGFGKGISKQLHGQPITVQPSPRPPGMGKAW